MNQLEPTADLLACPLCQSDLALIAENQVVICQRGHRFPIEGGVVDFTPSVPPDAGVAARWQVWEQLQSNGQFAYETNTESSLSIGTNPVEADFARFCACKGVVLDVGCGPQFRPSYAPAVGTRFVGLDPLRGVQPRAFEFVKGIGEYLPFKDDSFDRVLFGTTLDHMLDPQRCLVEAARVLKPAGTVCVWFAEMGAEASRKRGVARLAGTLRAVVRTRGFLGLFRIMLKKLGTRPRDNAWKATLLVPPGAHDHFHLFTVTGNKLDAWLEKAGLTPVRREAARDGLSWFLQAAPTDEP